MEELKQALIRDPVEFVESIFRVRNNKGELVDYEMTPAHKRLLRNSIVGNGSEKFRVVNKGRQIGFSVYCAIEAICIAILYPSSKQYYVATKEELAKEWLMKVEQIAKDARILADGTRIIDLDVRGSSQLSKKFVINTEKEIEFSYIKGIAASPRIRGMTGINVILDEYDHMNKEKDLQEKMWNALEPVLSQEGSQCMIMSTPLSKTGKFWYIYSAGERIHFTPYYFPVIENWKELNLGQSLIEQKDKMIMLYPWISIDQLERERCEDVHVFMQERLGIPSDILHRYITPELLEASSNSKMISLKQDMIGLKFDIAIDVASVNDITAVSVGFRDAFNVMNECNLYSTFGDYPEQELNIDKFLTKYKGFINKIRIDNTGIGKSLADYLKRRGYKIERINFNSTIEARNDSSFDREITKSIRIGTFMAEQMKRDMENSTFRLLGMNEPCQYIRQASIHVLNVEQEETPTTREKHYSGKRNGRDDFFWARAMLNADFNSRFLSGTFSLRPSNVKFGNNRRIVVKTVKRKSIFGNRFVRW